MYLMNKGYAVASINYRLSNEAHFPAQIHDCKAAVRWLRANAKQFNLDPDHFGAWGVSAGGHLAALLGTSGESSELEVPVGKGPQVSSQVQAVCDWFGPTDLEKFAQFKASGPGMGPDYPMRVVTKLLGAAPASAQAAARAANPITYVSSKSASFLILHGDGDTIVPLEQSQLLAAALKEKGAEVRLEVLRGAGHAVRVPDRLGQVEQFFNKHLAKTAEKGMPEATLLASFAQRTGRGAVGSIEFYTNGAIGSPTAPDTWLLKGNTLWLYRYNSTSPVGLAVDTCVLSDDGRAYRGQSQDRVAIEGRKTSGGDLRKNINAGKK
jgi:acetyl esterase/lipase